MNQHMPKSYFITGFMQLLGPKVDNSTVRMDGGIGIAGVKRSGPMGQGVGNVRKALDRHWEGLVVSKRTLKVPFSADIARPG